MCSLVQDGGTYSQLFSALCRDWALVDLAILDNLAGGQTEWTRQGLPSQDALRSWIRD